jgi:small subunit ribosomal protein S17e
MHKLFINPIRIKGYGGTLGRIRTKLVKAMAKQLIEHYPNKFSKDFSKNKKFLEELNIVEDKPVRNKIAGYIVKLKRAT